MSELPSGTVTFLFTDVEGSTARWERRRDAMAAAVARHDALLTTCVGDHGGAVFKTVGDAVCAVFPRASAAVACAAAAQHGLAEADWSGVGGLAVRMALHTGATDERDGDYFGPPVNRVARVLSAGHGGQVLLTQAVVSLVVDQLPTDLALRDLGEHRLKDLTLPERVYQLVVPGLRDDFPPLNSLTPAHGNLPVQATHFVGRVRELEAACATIGRGEVRLLTLLGPGGIGKTRLALQLAAEAVETFAHGAFSRRLRG